MQSRNNHQHQTRAKQGARQIPEQTSEPEKKARDRQAIRRNSFDCRFGLQAVRRGLRSWSSQSTSGVLVRLSDGLGGYRPETLVNRQRD